MNYIINIYFWISKIHLTFELQLSLQKLIFFIFNFHLIFFKFFFQLYFIILTFLYLNFNIYIIIPFSFIFFLDLIYLLLKFFRFLFQITQLIISFLQLRLKLLNKIVITRLNTSWGPHNSSNNNFEKFFFAGIIVINRARLCLFW